MNGHDGGSQVLKLESDAGQVAWPSGEGVEFGIVDLSLEAVAALVRKPIVEDDGIFAVVLDAGPEMPVTFVSEPKLAGALVAIIADRSVETRRLHRRVEKLVRRSAVHWHDMGAVRA